MWPRATCPRCSSHERLASEAPELRPREAPPGEEIATIDEVQRARQALQKLSPDQRRVLDLAVTRGYTHEQIAQITDLPLGTVKTHARRGLRRVRELLGRKASSGAPENDA